MKFCVTFSLSISCQYSRHLIIPRFKIDCCSNDIYCNLSIFSFHLFSLSYSSNLLITFRILQSIWNFAIVNKLQSHVYVSPINVTICRLMHNFMFFYSCLLFSTNLLLCEYSRLFFICLIVYRFQTH